MRFSKYIICIYIYMGIIRVCIHIKPYVHLFHINSITRKAEFLGAVGRPRKLSGHPTALYIV